jgi:crotonobetainyl-CoA:carnitine CoA-transferase CaiB-like acyl-CoA transferase
MSALFYRERHGVGQFIDIALLDSIMPLMGWVAANLLIGGQQPTLLGNDNFTAAPSGMFVTKDGYINIAANKQEQWHAVTDVLEVPELKEDPRFKERDTRKANRYELTPILEAKLKERNTEEWVALLNKAGVPSGAILGLEQALLQPQAEHRQTFNEVRVDELGRDVKLFNMTAKFSETPGMVETPPPTLSQHTNEILESIGYSAEDIASLKENGVV